MLNRMNKTKKESLERAIKRAEKNKWLKRYFNGIYLIGRENIASIKNEQFIAFSNHLSHWDYIQLGYLFVRELPLERFPTIIAGKNLDRKLLQLIGLDFKSMGALFVDREKINSERKEKKKPYLNELSQKIAFTINQGENLLDFPEGGRNYSSKSVGPFKNGTLREILESKKDLYILNMAVDYDFRIEEDYFKLLKKTKSHKVLRPMYYLLDAIAFIIEPTRMRIKNQRGNSYISIQKPKKLYEIINSSDNFNKAREKLKTYITEGVTEAYQKIQKFKLELYSGSSCLGEKIY